MAEHNSLYTHYNLYAQHHHGRGFFHLEPMGDGKVSIRVHHGRYVAASERNHIYLAYEHHKYDTKFLIEWFPDGKVAFKTHHAGYIGVDDDGKARVHYQRGINELFDISSA